MAVNVYCRFDAASSECGIGATHEAMSLSAGTVNKARLITGPGCTWVYEGFGPLTIGAGNWDVKAIIYTLAGIGAPTVRCQVKHRSADCTVLQTIIDQTLPMTKEEVVVYTFSAVDVPQVVVGATDVITVEFNRGGTGDMDITLRYNGGAG